MVMPLPLATFSKRKKKIYVDTMTLPQKSNLKFRLEKELLHFIWGMHFSSPHILEVDLPSSYQCLTQPTELKKPTQGESQESKWLHTWLKEYQSHFFIPPFCGKDFNSLAIKDQGILYVFQAFPKISFQILKTIMSNSFHEIFLSISIGLIELTKLLYHNVVYERL